MCGLRDLETRRGLLSHLLECSMAALRDGGSRIGDAHIPESLRPKLQSSGLSVKARRNRQSQEVLVDLYLHQLDKLTGVQKHRHGAPVQQ